METVVTTLKERRNNRRKKAKEEVKIEDLETANASKEDHSKEEEPVSIDSSRYPFCLMQRRVVRLTYSNVIASHLCVCARARVCAFVKLHITA